jgi:hypothetical protein
MDIEYVKKIQKWVEYDNKITKFKDDMKEYVDKKKEIEETILEYVEKNNYDKLTINISDGNIKFSKRNTTQPLSMRTLKNIFEKYSSTNKKELDTNDLLNFIQESLETKTKIHMNREIKTT